MQRVVMLVCLLWVSPSWAGITFSASTSLTPVGGAAQSLVGATGAGALAGRFASAATGIGVAVSAIQICMLTNCYQYLPGFEADAPPVPGWADPETPPSTEPYATNYRIVDSSTGIDVSGSTADSACTAYWSAYNGIYGTSYLGETRGTLTCYANSSASFGVSIGVSQTCPAHYVYSSSTGLCHLIPEEQGQVTWPSDGIPTLTPSVGGGWKDHPRDPDSFNGTFAGGGASGQWDNPPSMPSSSGEISASGHDQHGNPQTKTVTALPDGGTKYQETTQGINSSTGQTETSHHDITTNSAGEIVNYTYQIFENQTINQVTQNTSGGTGSVTIDLPDDYARENTLNAAKNLLADIKDALSVDAPGQPPSGPDVSDETINIPQISESGSSLGSGSCPAGIPFTVFGTQLVVSLDPMCQMAVIAGYLILGFSYYLAARIVGGGILPS